MADLFEQLVADYLSSKGYLTKVNVSYRKADGIQTGSDIDVLAIHGKDRNIIVGDCKSGYLGFSGNWLVTSTAKSAQREQDRFKAVFRPERAEGLARKVEEECGLRSFVCIVYCASLDGGWDALRKLTVAGNPIEVVPFAGIVRETLQRVQAKEDRSIEPTALGRFVQLLDAAKVNLQFP